jgi:sugar lactone lactonase YvrE
MTRSWVCVLRDGSCPSSLATALSAALLLGGAGCGPGFGGGDDDSAAGSAECPGRSAGAVFPFSSVGASTEGVAVRNDGALLVSSGDSILQIGGDGTAFEIASVPEALGLSPQGSGVAVAAWDDSTGAAGGVWTVDAQGNAQVLAPGLDRPNALAATPWGTLLVSDDFDTRIFEIDPSTGLASTWLDGIESPNGIAFSADGGTLFVATTFVDPPGLWAVPVSSAGLAGIPSLFASFPTGSAPDGLVLDADGNVFVALNVDGSIARVSPQGEASTFAGGLDSPASLAFGLGGDFDPCSMYVTSLFGDTVSRVENDAVGGVIFL